MSKTESQPPESKPKKKSGSREERKPRRPITHGGKPLRPQTA